MLLARDIVAQIGNKDFKHERGKSSGLFAIVTASDGALSYIFPGHTILLFFSDPIQENRTQQKTMGEVNIPPDSVLIGKRFVRHAWAEC